MNKRLLGLVLLFNILIRIPRMTTPYGIDGFYLLWEAKILLRGLYFKNGVNIFFLLGLYPFSGYPIGSISFMSVILLITHSNDFMAIFLYDIFCTTIFVYSITLLSKNLFSSTRSRYIFILLATTIPNFVLFSYFTSSARILYLAFLPFYITLTLKWLKSNELKYSGYSFLMLIFLLFLHRMAMLLIIQYIMCVFLSIGKKFHEYLHLQFTKKKGVQRNKSYYSKNTTIKDKIIKYYQLRSWLLLVLVLSLISVILNLSEWHLSFDIYQIFGLPRKFPYTVLELAITLWFNGGLVFIFCLFSIFQLLFDRDSCALQNINKNPSIKYLILSFAPFFMFLNNIYAFQHYILVMTLLSSITLNILSQKKHITTNFLLIFSFLLVFMTVLFYSLLKPVGLHLIYSGSLLLLALLFIVLKSTKVTCNYIKCTNFLVKNKQKFNGYVFILLIILSSSYFTIFQEDRNTLFSYSSYISPVVSPDELLIVNFLNEHNIGVFDSWNYILSSRIAALSGWLFIQDWHSLTVFLSQNESLNSIHSICNISSPFQWYERAIFECSVPSGRVIYRDLITGFINSSIVISIITQYNLQYFISKKNSDIAIVWGTPVQSPFINSLFDYGIKIFETPNYIVWDLSFLYADNK